MQNGEALGAHAETPESLWNPDAQPAKLSGLGPKQLIERVLAFDERVQLCAAALLRQNAGDAFPQRIESRLIQSARRLRRRYRHAVSYTVATAACRSGHAADRGLER
jgi:hypothetical protein